ncbi:MAG: hemerythrin domain-containing protein [Pseudomonadota bacterium]
MDNDAPQTFVIDPSERPKGPELEGLTLVQKIPGRHLKAIHAGHLRNIKEIRDLLDLVRAGRAEAGALKDQLDQALFAQNLRGFGTLCGQECQLLGFHHDAEEHGLFNELETRGSDVIRSVVKRLREEHKIVHALLSRLDAAADTLQDAPSEDTFEAAAKLFELLEAAVMSHFAYEEETIADAMGVYLEGP